MGALDWMINGEVGLSSKALALTSLGKEPFPDYPRDPDDLRRCLLLIEQVPEARTAVNMLAERSRYWAALAPIWDDLKTTLEEEAGPVANAKGRATKTYAMMREALDGVMRRR